MTTAKFIIGDALTVLRTLDSASVQCIITSPPYLRQRDYLPLTDPQKVHEIGKETTPADHLTTVLEITDELWRVLADDGTMWWVSGQTASGSGGAGGDYNEGGMRAGQPKYAGTSRAKDDLPDKSKTRAGRWGQRIATGGHGWPKPKSICWLPELFGASLAYGRNLLTGEPCQQWITRPHITWCKTNPSVGAILDKCREATELIVFATKKPKYFFDLDAIREEAPKENARDSNSSDGPKNSKSSHKRFTSRRSNPNGKPPLNWWVVPTKGYEGAHYATFPPDLIARPVIAGCPEGGTILDPFAGTGTTLMVATGNSRNAIGIDLDHRNAILARERVGMWLEIEDRREPLLEGDVA